MIALSMCMPAPFDRVDVWTTRSDEASDSGGPLAAPAARDRLERYRTLLSPEETARCNRLLHEADQQRFLIARAMVRTMLSQYVDIPPAAWRFRIETYGRPEVAELPYGAPDLRFNLSHTTGLVTCAVTVGRDIGVDVENVHREVTHEVPERFFSAQEVADLRALPAGDQPLAFFDYWTLKEAYIKARGLGLALPLGQFTFHRRPGQAPIISFAPELHDDASSWQFALFWPTADHRMAIGVRRSGADLPIEISSVVPEVSLGSSGVQAE